MLTLDWEPLRRLLDEGVEELLARHWEEVAVDHDIIPLAPDWDRAFALQAAGVLRTAALRRNGRLIGYNAFHVLQPLHYRLTTHAINDVLYVDPDERGTAGLRLLRGTEQMLRELGVVKVVYHTKLHVAIGAARRNTVGDMLARLGYRLDEEIYTLLL